MEIGSEYHIDFTGLCVENDNLYDFLQEYHVFFADYGRTATRLLYQYIAEKAGYDVSVLLPSYICDAVLQAFPANKITFYGLKENFEPDSQCISEQILTGNFDGGIFYLVHYFGNLVSEEVLKTLKKNCDIHGITVIEDTTHSIFTNPSTIGEYCVASLRKWMALPEGGVIYSKRELPLNWKSLKHASASPKIEAMVLKKLFLSNARDYRRLENTDQLHEAYRNIFVNEEKKIDMCRECCQLSDLSMFLLKCESIKKLTICRKENYRQLRNCLGEYGIFLYNDKIGQNTEIKVPFTALMLLDDRNDRNNFKKYLIDQNIYCPVHWPIENQKQLDYKNVKRWTEQIISLPIDQRYGVEEMNYMADKIITYFKG